MQILQIFCEETSRHLLNSSNLNSEVMNTAVDTLMKQLESVINFIKSSLKDDSTVMYTAARDLAVELGHIYIGKFNILDNFQITVLCIRIIVDISCFHNGVNSL